MTIRKTEETGKIEQDYELYTNDPQLPVIKLKVTGIVRPVPDYVKKIENANIETGVKFGPFVFWPAVEPVVYLQRGEKFSLSLRIRPQEHFSVKLATAICASDKVKCTLRNEENKRGYWLDIEIAALDTLGLVDIPISLVSSDGLSDAPLRLAINVVDSSIVVTPESLDLGRISIKDLKSGMTRTGRVGLRVGIGSFQIKSLSSDLAFVHVEKQTIIEGSNYLLKVSIDRAAKLKAGTYNGVIKIETDNPKNPVIELPCKMTVAQ